MARSKEEGAVDDDIIIIILSSSHCLFSSSLLTADQSILTLISAGLYFLASPRVSFTAQQQASTAYTLNIKLRSAQSHTHTHTLIQHFYWPASPRPFPVHCIVPIMSVSTSNIITLKGSTDIVTEFFEYSVNSILYQRAIYPPESFRKVPKYGLAMMLTTDEALAAYISNIMIQLQGRRYKPR